ncbi:MAG TPA: DNA polymerase Y family protein [Burkholderiales bacterium]|nr:DNA polymerase Y family protein [Burkholderiales bacterium]
MWTCLYFPALSLQVQARPAQPTVVADNDSIFICNESAKNSGIKSGMKLNAAFALNSRLEVFPRDQQKELAALNSIALSAMQFTPTVSLAPPFAVLLEIGGSLPFFGGLDALLEKIRGELGSRGFVLSSAPTSSGALLLCRAGLELQIDDIEQLKAQLDDLPVELLTSPPEVLQALKDIGMRTIRDVLALPRDGLARRFGQGLLDTLDRALGNLPEARSLFVPPANYANKLELSSPVWEAEALLFATKRLIGELAGFLSAKNAGVLKLNLNLHHEDEAVTRVSLALISATRDAAHLTSLIRERLFNLTLPQRVEAIALEACEVVPLNSRSFPLFKDREHEHETELIERLQARLGMGAVLKLSTFPDHRPELAWRPGDEPRHSSPPSTSLRTGLTPYATRPLWLLDPPRLLEAKDETPWLDGPLTLLCGPERIESGWWDGGDVARDYFVACDPEGGKFWIFLEHVYVNHPSEAISKSCLNRDRHAVLAMTSHERRWFLHGIFS